MEKERARAAEYGYPSPIQPDKESTDRDYNAAVKYCIDNVNEMAVIVASHNEESNLYTTRLLDEKGLPHDHPHVHFSQLYGMSDNITFNLAKAGYSVSKYRHLARYASNSTYLAPCPGKYQRKRANRPRTDTCEQGIAKKKEQLIITNILRLYFLSGLFDTCGIASCMLTHIWLLKCTTQEVLNCNSAARFQK